MQLVDGALLRAVGAAIDAAQAPAEVPWSSEAQDAWVDLYLELAMQRRYGLLGAMLARTESQVVRLALVYAVLDRSRVIEVAHLRAARALWAYAERSVAHVFGTSTGDRHADSLRALLADGPATWTDARRDLGVRTSADLETAFGLLRSLGIAEETRVRVAGAKKPVRVLRLVGTSATSVTSALEPAQGKGPE
jgi:hypothetical protein